MNPTAAGMASPATAWPVTVLRLMGVIFAPALFLPASQRRWNTFDAIERMLECDLFASPRNDHHPVHHFLSGP